jgi:hypothetical protein
VHLLVLIFSIYSLFIPVNCFICFGWYPHPSSEARVTVSTPSGICKTVTATFHERGWTGISSHPVTFTTGCSNGLQMPNGVDTVTRAPDDWWRYHPKHGKQFTDINKLYIVASCWIIIDIFMMHGPLNVKLCSFPTDYIYGFHIILTINSDYFLSVSVWVCRGETVCMV